MTAPPAGTRTVQPSDDAPPPFQAQRAAAPETGISSEAQRGIEECETAIREARAAIVEAQVRLERAIERRARLEVAQRVVGISYGE